MISTCWQRRRTEILKQGDHNGVQIVHRGSGPFSFLVTCAVTFSSRVAEPLEQGQKKR